MKNLQKEKLKQLKIYDETMIVVAGDHGTDITKKTRPVYKRRAQPVLLIKPFHGEGDLQSSQAPTGEEKLKSAGLILGMV